MRYPVLCTGCRFRYWDRDRGVSHGYSSGAAGGETSRALAAPRTLAFGSLISLLLPFSALVHRSVWVWVCGCVYMLAYLHTCMVGQVHSSRGGTAMWLLATAWRSKGWTLAALERLNVSTFER